MIALRLIETLLPITSRLGCSMTHNSQTRTPVPCLYGIPMFLIAQPSRPGINDRRKPHQSDSSYLMRLANHLHLAPACNAYSTVATSASAVRRSLDPPRPYARQLPQGRDRTFPVLAHLDSVSSVGTMTTRYRPCLLQRLVSAGPRRLRMRSTSRATLRLRPTRRR